MVRILKGVSIKDDYVKLPKNFIRTALYYDNNHVFYLINGHLNCLDFMKQSVEDVEILNEKYKSVIDVIGTVANHFGEDVGKFKIEECFALLGNFFERIDVVAKVK